MGKSSFSASDLNRPRTKHGKHVVTLERFVEERRKYAGDPPECGRPSGVPKFAGEVERLHGAYVYVHRDSRGGGTLIVAPSRRKADEVYVASTGAVDTGLAEDDFMAGPIDVIVVAKKLPQPGKPGEEIVDLL